MSLRRCRAPSAPAGSQLAATCRERAAAVREHAAAGSGAPPLSSARRHRHRPHTAPARRLQEAYLAALEQCGGLHEARPKTLLDMLQPRFPFLTLQARGSLVGGALIVCGHTPSRGVACPPVVGCSCHPRISLPCPPSWGYSRPLGP